MRSTLALSRAVLALSLLVAVGAPVPSDAEWTPLGPEGGSVNGLVVDRATPMTLYAAVGAQADYSYEGVYKSTDGGASWQPTATAGIASLDVRALAVHPTNHTVFALTDSTLARSTNGGASWTPLYTLFGGKEPHDLVLDPAGPNTIYVAANGGGVFKSTNGGTSFVPQNSGLPSLYLRAIAIAPTSPPALYVSTSNGGVYKSVDGAASWTPSNAGLPPDAAPQFLVVDPATPTTLVAASCFPGGVFRSVDGGASWSAATTGLPNAMPCARALAVTPTAPTRMLVALRDAGGPTVFASDDGGLTWTPSAADLDGRAITQFAFDPTTGSRAYAGTYGGFFRTGDGGATWTYSMSGIRHRNFWGVTVDPTDTSTIYGYGGSDGPGIIVKSTDGGATWVASGPRDALPAHPYILDYFAVWRLRVDPTNSNRLYLGTTHGIFRSTDGGTSWQFAAGASGDTWDIAVDPFDPNTLYSGTDGPAVLKSTDAGATWAPSNSGISSTFMRVIVPDPQHAGVVYGTSPAVGIFKTIDHGASWTRLEGGLPAPFTETYGPVVLDPTNSMHLFNEAGPIRESTDGGLSWTARPHFAPGSDLTIDPVDPTIFYQLTDLTVLKSVDSAFTWQSMSPAGLAGTRINGYALDPVTGATVYVATESGLFKAAPITGVCTTAADCDDRQPCTVDVCDPGAPGADPDTGCRTTPVVCDDTCYAVPGFCDEGFGGCRYNTPPLANGTPCDDGDLCTFDRCVSGVCTGNPVPEPTCEVAQKTSLKIQKRDTSDHDKLTWKWTGGWASFPSPLTGGEYALCVYDRSGASGASVVRLDLTPALGAATCRGKPCWRSQSGGVSFGYKDKSAAHDGLKAIKLGGGNAPKGRIAVQAAGAELSLPPLPLTPRFTVQLRGRSESITRCWGADYEGLDILTNAATGVKAATR